ncbi:MAG: Transamidase GatB domain protein [uncultured Nocardioidaceae bacterium]|uniref:Transamidase GatB domain protein n=1 Tax=uncultured Nocardioidaceae bacterium TaxID=253824 RepID=A0A6J4LVD7_9ACTN|nr:MAG: Transamidase GatB domain protein [uncultured Nocardioidaceae bacterium]
MTAEGADMLARIRTDLTASMKARDELRSSTLRMVLAAVQTAEVAGKQARRLSDDEVVGVVAAEAKKRRESATAFDGGGRPELADKERAEAEILAEYLPEQLDADAISALVARAVAETGAAGEGMRAMGKVMGRLQPQVRGRADGGVVAAEVKRQLGA